MDVLYCSISDVKRLLRSIPGRESKVRFSSAYKGLLSDDGNNGDIALSGVTFNAGFSGHETFTFEFTDSTTFDISGDVLGNLGSGDRFTDSTSSDNFLVPSANWSGAAQTGDKVYITADSDLSDDDGTGFIEDATRKINAELETRYGSLDNIAYYDDATETIPDGVVFACIRYAAYEIFNSLYAGMAREGESPVEGWNKSASETLDKYLAGKGLGPRWRSRALLVTELGVEGVGDGIIKIDELSDAKNKEYTR